MSARSEGRILWGAFIAYPDRGAEEAYIETYSGADVPPDESYGVIHDAHGHWHVILAPDRIPAEERIYETCTEAQAAAERLLRLDREAE